MNPHHTAWECAFVLITQYPDRLTPEQYIRAFIATMRPERADLECIAVLAQLKISGAA